MLTLLLAAAQAQPAVPLSVPPPVRMHAPVAAATRWPVREGDAVFRDFVFRSGERLPALKLHYATLGTPHRDAGGAIDNAVMVLHGTGGSGRQFLQPQFAEVLFGPGQPLDIRRYWIILPDNIGHGASSRPSDGLRMRFPLYDCDDMVAAQHRLPADHLGIRRARLIMGTSMGCMHALVWGETFPDFARALMSVQPAGGVRGVASLLFVAGGAPLWLQAQFPTRDAAADHVRQRVSASIAGIDANDLIYPLDSSCNYDPWPRLEAITAPVTWINSADDFINPRNLDLPQRAAARMRDARFGLIPETAETRGHDTHSWARFWRDDLVALLARTEPK